MKSVKECRPVVLDLFCGAGGMSFGFEMAGFHIGLGIEKDPVACKTHSYNFGVHTQSVEIEDIKNPEGYIKAKGIESVDVIIGGPPCQGFSRVGRRAIHHYKGPNYVDPRNEYCFEFIRFAKALRPLYFVIENVPDMEKHENDDGLILDQIEEDFREIGYETTKWKVLHADDFGVPQTRKRLFIVGNRIGKPICWPHAICTKDPITVWEAISDLPIVEHGVREDEIPYTPRFELTEYQQWAREYTNHVHEYTDESLTNHQTRWHRDEDLEAFEWLEEGGKYVELPEKYKRYRDDIFKDKYRKFYRDRPAWTIEAHIAKDSYRYIYPSRKEEPEPSRTISVREAARIQSFPDSFHFQGAFTRKFHQIGNAVPPLLAKALAEMIFPQVLEEIC
ncbi:MAG: DNA cytosine methyltransferase [Candidatus Poribacteria bacterium]|nr:DNA cytosine methyltransferase [Candidatus Poribacteria bacterium]